MLKIFLLCSLVTFGHPWVIVSSHKNVTPRVTENVNIKCLNGGKSVSMPSMIGIIGIQILKLQGQETWRTFAKLFPMFGNDGVTNSSVSGLKFVGNVGDTNDTFLSITWSTSTQETLGSYRCHVTGINAYGKVMEVKTAAVTIAGEGSALQYAMLMIKDLQKEANQTKSHLLDVEHELEENKNIIMHMKNETQENQDTILELIKETGQNTNAISDVRNETIQNTKIVLEVRKETQQNKETISDVRQKTKKSADLIQIVKDKTQNNKDSILFIYNETDEQNEIIADLMSEADDNKYSILQLRNETDDSFLSVATETGNIKKDILHVYGKTEENRKTILDLKQESENQNSTIQILNYRREKNENQIKELKNEREESKNVIQTVQSNVKHDEALYSRLNSSIMKVDRDSRLRDDLIQRQIDEGHWPQGGFGLMNTKTGCPNLYRGEFKEGFISTPTESSSGQTNKDSYSSNNHLMPPVKERKDGKYNIFNLRFCQKPLNSSGKVWPSGSYCLWKVGNSCPQGFGYGYIRLNLENDGSPKSAVNIGKTEVGSRAGVIFVNFCCRADGHSNVPIHLPTKKPFYLYRFRGICQAVHNMVVTPEWILLDTENDDNNMDSFGGTYHADGTLKDVRIELCHYQRAD